VRLKSTALSLALASTLLTAAAPALAQQQPTPAGEDPARVEEARARYREGLQLFQRRQYAEATVAFERSFHLRPHPFTLYNAAEARMRAGDNAGAIAQLRDLLAMTDPAPDAELAGRARTLAQGIGEQNLQPSPPRQVACPACPPPPPVRECPPPPPPTRVTTQVSPGAWALAGGSLVLTAVGAGFLGVAIDNASSYANPLAPRPLQDELRSQGETYRIIGVVGLVAGVGAAVGAVWMLTHPRRVEEPAPTARVDFGVGPGGVAVSGTF
jgi:tetratricopeptide (TPR) repeat protein